DDWRAFEPWLGSVQEAPTLGVATRLTPLDRATCGLQGVALLAGNTGSGKTTLAANISLGALRQDPGPGGVVFSLGMDKNKYFAKLLSLESGVDYRTLTSGSYSPKVQQSLGAAKNRLTDQVLNRMRVVDSLGRPAHWDHLRVAMQRAVGEFERDSGVKR